MSTIVCHTRPESLPAFEQASRYHWPSSSSERNPKQPVLRIVTTESTPPDVCSPDSMLYTLGHSAASTSRANPGEAPEAGREPSRLSNNIPSVTLAHPFPSSASPTASRGHSRAKSTTEHIENASRTTRRARAASSATIGTRTRPPSILASLLTQHRVPAQPRTAAHDPDQVVGSFTPTSSPRPRLQSLLSGLGAGSSDSISSTIGASPLDPSPPPSRFATVTRSLSRPRYQSEGSRSRARAQTNVPPASPMLPSICRTPSSYSGSDYFIFPTPSSSTAPSSAGPATPVHTAPALPVPSGAEAGMTRKSSDYLTLHPVLETLERSSKLSVQTACATCGKRGSNFPTCPRCGEMWCSRPCRLQRGNGKRHICAKKC